LRARAWSPCLDFPVGPYRPRGNPKPAGTGPALSLNAVRSIELLAPARDLEAGLAAVSCGADAVYIGAPRFGAREAAGNSVTDIEKLVRYAHKYWARVYVTLNTLIRDSEVSEAVSLARTVHEIGADALIIQDVGLLQCDLPPIPLFASTQMHNNTPEKIAFLEGVGMQRVILARELNLQQIAQIRSRTSVELEAFVHGALCVGTSGQCYLSYALGGRSANRGECAQPCRRVYSLVDSRGQRLIESRHLLSIRDLNNSENLRNLLNAGITSFKIEGRLKDKYYVMNVVGHYRRLLDSIMRGGEERKSSSGKSVLDFEPDPDKTFNRGYTSWFVSGRREKMGSFESPKMVGMFVGAVASVGRDCFRIGGGTAPLRAGDGISFYGSTGELEGTRVNRVEGNLIYPARMDGITRDGAIFRNHDESFFARLRKSNVARRIDVWIEFSEIPDGYRLRLQDEDGVIAFHDLVVEKVQAQKADMARAGLETQLAKLGETEFACAGIRILTEVPPFLPISVLNGLRRDAVEALRRGRQAAWVSPGSAVRVNDIPYPETSLSFLGNVLNRHAEAFYRKHGVSEIEPAPESGLDMRGRKVMTTKYCLKHELDGCPRGGGRVSLHEPLSLIDDQGRRLRLEFDCRECCMNVFYE
jgi:23S rRNA 5-hydroxycytidine C2501 synthase